MSQRILGQSALVLAAAMPRSASTWLYNVARILISRLPEAKDRFSCGWVGDWQAIPKKPYMLIKIHDYNQGIADSSRLILYSYRDIRDALASLKRKFDLEPSLAQADHLLAQDEKWVGIADYVMRYESMLADGEAQVVQLADALGIQDVDPAEIVERVSALSYESGGGKNEMYHAENLYHRQHMTDGRHGSWHGVLDADLVLGIEQKHRAWLVERGYISAGQ